MRNVESIRQSVYASVISTPGSGLIMKKLCAMTAIMCAVVLLTGSAFGLEIQLSPRTLVLSSGGDQLTIHTDFPYKSAEEVTLDIGDTVAALCQDAGLSRKLEQRPSVLNDAELLKAITIREMAKLPLLMLVDRPENFMDITETDAIFSHLKNMVLSGTAVVFFSHNQQMVDLATRQLMLAGETIHMRTL